MRIFILMLFLGSSPMLFAQTEHIPTLTFEQFEQQLKPQSDTTYVFNFWATWCKPCVAELHLFEELREEYKDEKVKVVLVSLDFPSQMDGRLIPFVNQRKIQSDVLLLDAPDYNSWIPKVSEEWGGAIPATYIVKKDQSDFFEGQLNKRSLNKMFSGVFNP